LTAFFVPTTTVVRPSGSFLIEAQRMSGDFPSSRSVPGTNEIGVAVPVGLHAISTGASGGLFDGGGCVGFVCDGGSACARTFSGACCTAGRSQPTRCASPFTQPASVHESSCAKPFVATRIHVSPPSLVSQPFGCPAKRRPRPPVSESSP